MLVAPDISCVSDWPGPCVDRPFNTRQHPSTPFDSLSVGSISGQPLYPNSSFTFHFQSNLCRRIQAQRVAATIVYLIGTDDTPTLEPTISTRHPAGPRSSPSTTRTQAQSSLHNPTTTQPPNCNHFSTFPCIHSLSKASLNCRGYNTSRQKSPSRLPSPFLAILLPLSHTTPPAKTEKKKVPWPSLQCLISSWPASPGPSSRHRHSYRPVDVQECPVAPCPTRPTCP